MTEEEKKEVEKAKRLRMEWAGDVAGSSEVLATGDIVKVDSTLGLVLGYAIVCKNNGKEYYDTQGDHITEEAMLEAATDFMQKGRTVKEMHAGKGKGTVVFAWPMTTDVAKAFGMKVKKTGLLVAIKPDDPDILEKFRTGEYTGFSIGGSRVEDEEIEEESDD